jgi:hypothetical protein
MATTRKALIRGGLRRGQDHGEDYDKAAQTLGNFHSLTSSALNIILEEDDDASTRRAGMVKAQTCSCLTALQKSTERKSKISLSSQAETVEDDEWGYFSEPLLERPVSPVRRKTTVCWELKRANESSILPTRTLYFEPTTTF